VVLISADHVGNWTRTRAKAEHAMIRRVIDLNGSVWRLGQAPDRGRPDCASWHELERVAEWLPATVPGNVRADLARAGRLPNLYFGTQAEASHWVDHHCWWLLRECPLSASPGERVHLVMRGVDYISDCFFNGHYLGCHEGMFSPQVYDVTELLVEENRLAVRIVGSKWLPSHRSSPWLRFLNNLESRTASIGARFPQRRDTLKCQMSFGWDFAPPLRTMGIWDDVYAVISQDLFLRDWVVQQQLTPDGARLNIEVELDARTERLVQLRCSLIGETFESKPIAVEQPLELAAGPSRHTIELLLPQPRLWWPWDHGRPDLYRLVVEAWAGVEHLDSLTQTIGLRQVELEDWTLRLNGRRVYARGANWVPADILPGHVDEAAYYGLLSLARQANMNLLRVWGGGLREKQAFYDLCDRLGILVWQEFPLACAFLTRFPRSEDYRRLVESEAQAIVRDLRNHPSLILWCGGNEFDPGRNEALVSTLQQVVAREDPARPFLPASPAGGDSHNWKVWHDFHPPSVYRHDQAAFASEFGLQAPPGAETLQGFIPPDELWPPGPSWTYHGAGMQKLWRYARPFLQEQGPGLKEFLQASQRAQAHGLQIAIEHYRRRKAAGCGGVLVWQLNEPWPAISWALIDFYRQPKPAYETVTRLLAPLLISLDYPLRRYQAGDDLAFDLWVVNDRHQALTGCQVEVILWDGIGQPAHRFEGVMDVAGDSARIVSRLRWILPPGDGWRLTCALLQNGLALATNEYDLSIHDDIGPTVGQRLWAWLKGLVVPS
jgi:beta-mannosidase